MTCSVCPGFGKPACLWPFSCPSTVGLPTEQERALAAIARVRALAEHASSRERYRDWYYAQKEKA